MGYPQAVKTHAERPARILIADDLPDLLQALKETLEREGFVVTAVPDGQAALEAIRAEPPDIAVLDFKMPRMDGFSVCRALRALLRINSPVSASRSSLKRAALPG